MRHATGGTVLDVTVSELTLTDIEASSILDRILGLQERFEDPSAADFLSHAPVAARHLPERVQRFIAALRYQRGAPAAVIRGFPVAEAMLGPTPTHWRHRAAVVDSPADFWLALVTAQLGDLVSWASLQDGRLLNDIHPIASQETQQTGHSSSVALDLHVEDAFHDHRCDNLALLCLRNPDRAATTVAAIDAVDVSSPDFDPLFEPRFLIEPDDEHRRNLATLGIPPSDAPRPVPTPVLFGCRTSPYIRIDPPYMTVLDGDERASAALARLTDQLAGVVVDVALAPGDLLLVDNLRALHGRRPFTARYDGTDRWLRRATTVRDLCRSRGYRSSAADRVIHPTAQSLALTGAY